MKPSSCSTGPSARSGIENLQFDFSACRACFGGLRFTAPGSIIFGRKKTALEIRGLCHREIQRRSSEVLEHLSHREKRPAAGALVETLSAGGYQGTRNV